MIIHNARVIIDGNDIDAKKVLVAEISGIVIIYKSKKIGSKKIITHISKCIIEKN